MGSYTTVPTGSPIQPSIISRRTFSITGNVVLYWPTTFYNTNDVVAGFMAITATNNSSNIIMPDISLVSTGTVVLITNLGPNTFSVYNNNLTLITSVQQNQLYYLNLSNNSVPATLDSWYVSLIGGNGTSGATAAQLKGYGLSVLNYSNNKLNTNFPMSTQSTNYQILYSDLASSVIMKGGANTVTLPLSTDVNIGNGFYVAINNQGTGILTVVPTSPDTLDGGSTFFLNPSTNAWFATDGAGHYYSFGFSEIQLANVTWPSGTVSTPAIRNSADHDTGMFWPSSGNLGFSCRVTEGTGILVLNLSNTLVTAFTPLAVPAGSNNAPTFTFSSDPTSGFSYTTNSINVSVQGVNRLSITNTKVNSFLPIQSPGTGGIANPAFQITGLPANSGIWGDNNGIYTAFNNSSTLQIGTGIISATIATVNALNITNTAITIPTNTTPFITNANVRLLNNAGLIVQQVSVDPFNTNVMASRVTLTAGVAVINNTNVTVLTMANVSYATINGTPGVLEAKTENGKINITSYESGTTTVNTADSSIVNWFIIQQG